MTTPLEIMIALHYCCQPEEDFGMNNGSGAKWGAPAVQEALQRFCRVGLLEDMTAKGRPKTVYVATDGLRVYVEALTAVPWPVQAWQMPKRKLTEDREPGKLQIMTNSNDLIGRYVMLTNVPPHFPKNGPVAGCIGMVMELGPNSFGDVVVNFGTTLGRAWVPFRDLKLGPARWGEGVNL